MCKKIQEILKDKKYAKPIIIALFSLSIILIYRGYQSSKLSISNKVVAIETATVATKDMTISIAALGTVTPEYSATIRTQVNGQLTKVAFQDGQKVKKGDILAEIDPKTYKAQLLQYEGQLLRDNALLDNAKLDLKRYQELWKLNSVSKQVLDTQVALVKQYEGTVQLDQGLVDAAKINLNYCSIIAPFDGQVGLKLVTEGNLVQTSDASGIAVINMINPISIIFSVPEAEIAEITTYFNQNKGLKVEVYDQNQKESLGVGELKAIDNQIDVSTGTVKLKAEFKNDDNRLFSNQFVNVKLKLKKIVDAITLPSAAIQYGSSGSFVYLIENNKAKVVYIKIEAISDNDAIVTSGLEKDQVVAVSGVDKLIDGAEVFVPKKHGEAK